MNEKELRKKLKEIIPDDECNTFLRDVLWIPEIIELFKEEISKNIEGFMKDIIKETYCKYQSKETKDIMPIIYPIVDLKDVKKFVKKWFNYNPNLIKERW